MNELTTIDTTALAALRAKARLDSAPVWRPQPSDTVEGILVGSRMAEGPFGPQRQALIQTPEGSVVAIWLTDWLLAQLQAQAVELGDLVSLTFHGKETGRSGKAFNRMSVTVLKP
jgi:hypothetical protein